MANKAQIFKNERLVISIEHNFFKIPAFVDDLGTDYG